MTPRATPYVLAIASGNVVHPAGVEPATSGLGNHCSRSNLAEFRRFYQRLRAAIPHDVQARGGSVVRRGRWSNGTRAVHFVGFRGDEYVSARRAFGPPYFYHYGWDRRACREIAPDDLVVFAKGPHDQPFSAYRFDDLPRALLAEWAQLLTGDEG